MHAQIMVQIHAFIAVQYHSPSLRKNLLQILHSRALLLHLGHTEARSKRVLSVLDTQDFFLYRVLNDKSLHHDSTRLSDSVHAVDCLSLYGVVPPRVLRYEESRHYETWVSNNLSRALVANDTPKM